MATFVKCIFFIAACFLIVSAVDLWRELTVDGRRAIVTDVAFLMFSCGVIDATQSKNDNE